MSSSADHSPAVVIRRATLDDAGTIAALTDAAYAKYIPLLGRKPRPMTADYRQLVVEQPIWLLCLEDQPVAALVLQPEPEHMLIYSVVVSPQHQKRGWGRRLLAWAEEQARAAGYSRMHLYTNEHMVENIALYTRVGYQETGREPYLGSALVHMTKTLTPQ